MLVLKQSSVATILGTFLFATALPATAQKVLATGDVNKPDIVAEVIECKRSDGTLTLRIRLKNTGNQTTSFYIVEGRKSYDHHYVTAGKKKYLMLRDAEKKPLAPSANSGGSVRVSIKKGEAWTWWAKFPAPPPEITKINYTWPIGGPIDDIPCSDS